MTHLSDAAIISIPGKNDSTSRSSPNRVQNIMSPSQQEERTQPTEQTPNTSSAHTKIQSTEDKSFSLPVASLRTREPSNGLSYIPSSGGSLRDRFRLGSDAPLPSVLQEIFQELRSVSPFGVADDDFRNSTSVPRENIGQDDLGRHKCAQCPTTKAADLTLFHRLPADLKLKVISELFAPESPCIEDIFAECHDPWSCRNGIHSGITDVSVYNQRLYVPCPLLTRLGPIFHEEGHRLFFRRNVFVFDHDLTYTNSFKDLGKLIRWWRSGEPLRDPISTRLLDWIDRPEWQGVGSEQHRELIRGAQNYSPILLTLGEVDQYRYSIQHIVIKNSTLVSNGRFEDWDNTLKVDWSSLRNLKTLCLDLRAYTSVQTLFMFNPSKQKRHERKLVGGVEAMKCLKLKSLIVYGAGAGPTWPDCPHKEMMQLIFGKAVAVDGVLEFRDTRDLDW
ncbi:uncharacterized protein LY89DRAFT_441907 [Mollisia scopiformis]|uniref:Uncharacterized protein n=1 Tax=Mollisia scopiformis TaxID=149040 RepID=A0A194XKR8_MOLSC|nr:uncharacterized protein LY89DRAFT_441907 [Mollisia scopiformis]KUJ20372.1 hypothetical protein LY89DRAFT_441907 [Mollisia scopiformis]